MRTITIDFTASTVVGSYCLGKRGEHNATTLTFTPPAELSTESRTDNYRVAFNTGGKTVLSSAYTSVPFSIALGSQLTQHSRMSLQVIAYDADGEYVGKSDKLSSFFFEGSVDGTAVEIDGDNADIAYEVEQNTEARHTHGNKALLDTITENSDGDVTIDGSVFYTASETNTAIASAVAAAEGDLVEIASSATTSKYTAAELKAMGATGKGFSYLGNPVTGYKYSGAFYISLLEMDDGDVDRNSFIRIYAIDSSKSITKYDTRYLPIGYESNGLVYLNASSVLATDGWTPTADNMIATKKYVDENGGGGESLIGTYEVDYETVAIGSFFDELGTSVCFMGDVTGSEGNLNNKIITRIEGTLDGETYQDINAIALFNDGNYGSLIHKPYVRTEGGETFTAIWQSKESCSMGIENIASIKVYGTEATE